MTLRRCWPKDWPAAPTGFDVFSFIETMLVISSIYLLDA